MRWLPIRRGLCQGQWNLQQQKENNICVQNSISGKKKFPWVKPPFKEDIDSFWHEMQSMVIICTHTSETKI